MRDREHKGDFAMRLILTAVLLAVTSEIYAGFSREKFRNPENVHSPAYFWMWNSRLDPAQLKSQVDDMFSHGMRSLCIHPFPKEFRPGRFDSKMFPGYLTEEYFRVFSNVVEHAASLGMNVWLYDEGGWPSGGACGQIAAADSEGRFRHRRMGYGTGKDPFGPYVAPYGNGRANYPSMIEKGATGEFIRRTHEQYRKYVGCHFGKAIKFTFMDEPYMDLDYFGPNIGWTSDFEEEFRARKGYDIRPFAKRLLDGKYDFDADMAQKRIDYYDVMSSLFVERFMDPIRKWDAENGLKSSGHLDGEDLPDRAAFYGYGALLRSLRTMDVPGVDVIWRQLFPATGADSGRQVQFPRYASSVSHQKGGMLAMTESFGIFGNSFTPDQMKWLVDYQLVRGISMFLFGYYNQSNAGQWMLLFEPHSGPIAPWWDMEKPFFDYIARTASILADGVPVVDVAVYFDSRAFWVGGMESQTAGVLHDAAGTILDRKNCEYEYVDDDAIIAAEIRDGRMRVGAMSYSTLVLPASKWMHPDAKSRIEEFKRSGGRVLTMDSISEAPQSCAISGFYASSVRVARRRNGNETLYFLVNETVKDIYPVIDFEERGDVVLADPKTGGFIAVERGKNGFEWHMPPCGSAIFVVGAKADAPAAEKYTNGVCRLRDGWTLRPLSSYSLGEDDFEIKDLDEAAISVELGDWRRIFGDYFSGKALYTRKFKCEKKQTMMLDLGKVGWTCSVKLNGKVLSAKFFGPFQWEVEVLEGENVLEVTVANMLANAVSDPVKRAKVTSKYPPSRTYDSKQRVWDRENHESGLMGPVVLLEK